MWIRTKDTVTECWLRNVETGAVAYIRRPNWTRLDFGPPYAVDYTGRDNFLTGPQHDRVAIELMDATGGVNDGSKET